MLKRMSPAAIHALKEALSCIYWYKSDLRSFLQNSVGDAALVGSLNWGGYKRQIVADLVDHLCTNQGECIVALTRLCFDVTEMNSFPHLEHLEGGREKATKARVAVEQLRKLVESHSEAAEEEESLRIRQKEIQERIRQSSAVRQRLAELLARFMDVAVGIDSQKRGYDLERLLLDLFELFDLDPRASFRIVGEQIDGAFALDGTDYLFEAKWQAKPVSAGDLDSFSAKVQRRLENTLGLFLSMNGFSEDGIDAHSRGTPNTILMDGADLLAVLEQRIDFVSLLTRKKRHAAQTGRIFLPIHEILSR